MITSRLRHVLALPLLALLPLAAAAGTLSFQPTFYQIEETVSGLPIGIHFEPDDDFGECTVTGQVLVSAGSAAPGSDFELAGSFSLFIDSSDFNDGESLPADTQVLLTAFDDAEVEGTEFTQLSLNFDASSCDQQEIPVVWDGVPATVEILDNDLPPAQLAIVSGDGQSGSPGDTLAPLVIEVSVDGQPLSGEPVSWSVSPASAASLAAAQGSTGADGRASNTLTLNETGSIEVTAALGDGSSVSFSIESVALVGALTALSGDGQSALPGDTLAPFQVQVTGNGEPLAGRNVIWTLSPPGVGTLAAGNSTTSDGAGLSGNTLTLTAPGPAQVTAEVAEIGSVTFNVAAATPSNTAISIISGNNQIAVPGAELAPLVVALNADGSPLAGIEVSWQVSPAGAAVLATALSSSNADGRASNTLSLTAAGPVEVVASAAGIGSQSFVILPSLAALPGLGSNERALAGALDQACAAVAALPADGRSASQQDLLDGCVRLAESPDPVADLRILSPDEVATQGTLAIEASARGMNLLRGRLSQLHRGGPRFSLAGLGVEVQGRALPVGLLAAALRGAGGGSAGEDDPGFSRWGGFINGNVSFGDKAAGDGEPGFDFDTRGLTLGADYHFTDTLVGGLALGMRRAETDLAAAAGTVDSDGYSLAGYASYFSPESFYVDVIVNLGRQRYDSERRLAGLGVDQVARSDTDGRDLSLSLGGGRQFRHGSLTFGPYGRVVHSRLSIDGYEEYSAQAGAGSGLMLAIEEQDIRSTEAVLGGQLAAAISTAHGILMPQVNLEYVHQFADDRREIGGHFLADPGRNRFALQTDAPDRNYFHLNLSLAATLPGGRSLFLAYETVLGRDLIDHHEITGGLRLEF